MTQQTYVNGPVTRTWPLERVLFTMAGVMVLLSVALTLTVSPWFMLLTAFVGINQLMYATVGNCLASLVLRRMGFAASCRW